MGQKEHQTTRCEAFDEQAQEFERRRVRPLQIFDKEKHRPLSRQHVEPCDERIEGRLTLLLRKKRQGRDRFVLWDGLVRGKQRYP